MAEDNEAAGLLYKIKQYLLQYYEPVVSIREAQFHFSTEEIYHQLLRIYPAPEMFSAADVAVWLHSGGFTFFDFGEMRFEWLLKRSQ